jgi:hypothetical protein
VTAIETSCPLCRDELPIGSLIVIQVGCSEKCARCAWRLHLAMLRARRSDT